jgi:hypothetical protein
MLPGQAMDDRLEALFLTTRLLDQLGIPYLIGGSVASSAFGEFRHTNDVDFLIQLQPKHVSQLLTAFSRDYYIDEVAVRRALDRGTAFNAIHFESAYKMDFFVAPADPFVTEQFARRRLERVSADTDAKVYLASPEDVILSKLRWFRRGGETSDQQMKDVKGIVKVEGERLDRDYLREWAPKLGIADLLEQLLPE